MQNKNRVTQVVFNAIDELNKILPEGNLLEKSFDTKVFGKSGQLNSLALLNFIVFTEDIFLKEFGFDLAIVGKKEMSKGENPFETIGSLVDHVVKILEQKDKSMK